MTKEVMITDIENIRQASPIFYETFASMLRGFDEINLPTLLVFWPHRGTRKTVT
jgi:hypothetical protein